MTLPEGPWTRSCRDRRPAASLVDDVGDRAAGGGEAGPAVPDAQHYLRAAEAAQSLAQPFPRGRYLDGLGEHRHREAVLGGAEQDPLQGLAGGELVEDGVSGGAQDRDQRVGLVVPAGCPGASAEVAHGEQVLRFGTGAAGFGGY